MLCGGGGGGGGGGMRDNRDHYATMEKEDVGHRRDTTADRSEAVGEVERPRHPGSRPGDELEAALSEQAAGERDTMKKLIQENVNLRRQNRLVSERIKELEAKKEVMTIDLDCEKQHGAEIGEQLKDMRSEMRVLLMEAKRVRSKETDERKEDGASTDESLDNLQTRQQFTQCILHLQFRLKRLTEQEEAKDRQIGALQKRLSEKEHLAEELEKHVPDQSTMDAVRRRVEVQAEEAAEARGYRQTNVVRCSQRPAAMPATGQPPPQSAVCVVQ